MSSFPSSGPCDSVAAAHFRRDTMDSQQAQFLAQQLTQLWEGEFPATCKVLAAVPDSQWNYRPDAKSRSARELAAHLATGDIWFLRSIIEGAFTWDPERAKQAESQFTSTDAIVDFYKREFPAHIASVRTMPAEQLAATVDFFGMLQMPNA